MEKLVYYKNLMDEIVREKYYFDRFLKDLKVKSIYDPTMTGIKCEFGSKQIAQMRKDLGLSKAKSKTIITNVEVEAINNYRSEQMERYQQRNQTPGYYTAIDDDTIKIIDDTIKDYQQLVFHVTSNDVDKNTINALTKLMREMVDVVMGASTNLELSYPSVLMEMVHRMTFEPATV